MDFSMLPKADLHSHLTGMLFSADIRELANLISLDISNYEPLESKINFHNPQIWSLARKVISSPRSMARALEIVLKRQAEEGVKYSEIIINFYKILNQKLNISNTITNIEKVIIKAFTDTGIKSKIRVGLNRADGPIALEKLYSLFNDVNSKYFCGFDINGDEISYPIDPFLPILNKFSAKNVSFTVHAGEFPNNDNKLLEIINCSPLRIGHGLAFSKHPELARFLIKKNISLEICPTSNIITGVVPDISSHPIKKIIELGIPVVLCTDNSAIFKTTLSREYDLLSQNGVSDNKLREIAKYSMRYLD